MYQRAPQLTSLVCFTAIYVVALYSVLTAEIFEPWQIVGRRAVSSGPAGRARQEFGKKKKTKSSNTLPYQSLMTLKDVFLFTWPLNLQTLNGQAELPIANLTRSKIESRGSIAYPGYFRLSPIPQLLTCNSVICKLIFAIYLPDRGVIGAVFEVGVPCSYCSPKLVIGAMFEVKVNPVADKFHPVLDQRVALIVMFPESCNW